MSAARVRRNGIPRPRPRPRGRLELDELVPAEAGAVGAVAVMLGLTAEPDEVLPAEGGAVVVVPVTVCVMTTWEEII